MENMNSMTGFSLTKGNTPLGEVELEIKTLNSKNLDINCRLPRVLSAYETIMRNWIKDNVQRGKINFFINITKFNPDFAGEKVDPDLARHYHNLLLDLNKAVGINSVITTDQLLQFTDIFYKNEDKKVNEEIENSLKAIVDEGFKNLNQSRSIEGGKLKKDFLKRIEILKKLIKEIEPLAAENPKITFEKQKERLEERFSSFEFDESRMIQELALLSDKVDVTEEIVRFKSHIKLLLETLELSQPTGKKLNFILQELYRELNTLTVKTTIVEISHKVVVMKEEVERIREQIQNIE